MLFNIHRWRSYGIACHHHHHLTLTCGIISPQWQPVLKKMIILLIFKYFFHFKLKSPDIVWPPNDIFPFVNTRKLVIEAVQRWLVTCWGVREENGFVSSCLQADCKSSATAAPILNTVLIHFFSPPRRAGYASRLHISEKLVTRCAELAQAVSCRDTAKSVIDYLGASLTRGVRRTPEQRR